MKRMLSLLLALTLVLGLAVPALAAEAPAVTLTADKTSVAAGEDVTVTLAIDQAVSNLTVFQFNIQFNGELFELKSSSIGSACANTVVGNAGTAAGQSYVPVSALDVMGGAVALTAGTIASLTFTARADAAGDASFTVVKEALTDYDDFSEKEATLPAAPLSVTVTEAPALEGYTITAEADKNANIGESISVSFTVGNTEAGISEYNAYDLTVSYDSSKLSYVSAAAADAAASISENSGSVRIIGYGESKTFDTAVVTLNFTSTAAGDAAVKVAAAKVDNRANAPDKDTPDAALADDTTIVTVSEKFNVTLGAGLAADILVAESGVDYTFRATDADLYDYEVTAAIDGRNIDVTDNGDGTYTIPGAAITGPITITATMTGKAQTVTVQGSGAADVTAATGANYGTDYTFTVNKAEGYNYTVTVTVSGTEVATTAAGNSYTIPGTAITGPVVIAVTKTAATAETVTVTKPAYVSGADTAVKGEDYSFTIITEPGYTYSEPSVTIGDKTVAVTKDETTGAYTIDGDDVKGDIIIRVTRTSAKGIAVSEYITLDEKSVYLVTVTGAADGSIAKYAGNSMYWSEQYKAYAWLVISEKSLADMETEAENNVTIAAGTAAASIAYTGDVNMTGKTDVNDAQLTYDMYKARYEAFDTVSMEKFLRADVNGSRAVDTQDAAAIVAAIKTA